MAKRKKVSFVVGVNLDGPVIVDHVVNEDEEQKQNSKKSSCLPQQNTHSKITTSSKKTCGQSQKNVREKHKKNTHCSVVFSVLFFASGFLE